MKGFLRILLYFFTWQSIIIGALVFGALMLVLALNVLLLSPYAAFSISLLAFLGLLVVPYISSAPALRCLISSRNLCIIPHFSLKAGLALFLLTLLTAAFLPLAAWVVAQPDITFWLGPKIFIIASLYCALMQLVLPSQRSIGVFSFFPFVLMLVRKYFGLSLLALAANNTIVSAATVLTLLGWAYGLWILAHQQTFKPAYKSGDTAFSQHNALQGAGQFLGLTLSRHIPAAASLLFAYPASLPVRVINVGAWIVMWPLVCTVMMSLLTPAVNGTPVFAALPIFLGMSFFMGCLCFISVGELGARARLLWLRLPGGRSQVWRKLELELWTNLGLLTAILLVNVMVVLLISPDQAYLQHYVLLLLACACYDSYRTLCSRLYQWSSLVQALVMIVSLVSIIAAVVYSVSHG